MGFLALQHAPNQANEDHTKHMTPEQQAAFAHRVQGLSGSPVQHFDVGGTVNTATGTADVGQNGQMQNVTGNSTIDAIPNKINSTLFGGPSTFQAAGTNLQQGYSQGQINQGYNQAQNGLQQQQGLNNQLAGVNGVGNQQNVYNQYQGIANGTGPNPAMAALAQQTGNNVSNQAALMAGQRGAASNVGMMARQAAQQGAATQQQGVGQAATLQAQQSSDALGQMGQIAGQQVGAQQAGLSAYNTSAQNNLGQLYGQQNALNSNMTSATTGQNQANASIAAANDKKDGGIFGGVGSLIGSLAHGGAVPQHFDAGGMALGVDTSMPGAAPMNDPTGSYAANHLLGDSQPLTNVSNETVGTGTLQPDNGWFGQMQAMAENKKKGGGLAGLIALLANGGQAQPLNGEAQAQSGMKVPGQAKFDGDNYSNDTVPAMLSPGEIVVDREHSSDPMKAAQFAYAVAMRNQKRGGK